MIDIRLPQINAPTPQGQIAQIRSYLFQLAEQLQWAFNIEPSKTQAAEHTAPKQTANEVIEEAFRDVTAADGSKARWRYRKWANGVLECWCTRTTTVAIGGVQSGGLYNGATTSLDYPIAFVETPSCYVALEHGNETTPLLVASSGAGTKTTAPPITICGATSQSVDCDISFYAHGKWK